MTARAGAPYTLRSIEDMLGLSRRVVAGLIEAGFVVPTRGPRNEYLFSFQDVVLLRTAYQLREARIEPRRLLRSLRQLRAKLPADLPLSGLRIRAIGNDIAVRAVDAQWEADTGQLLLDFEVAATDGSVSFLQRGPAPLPAPAPTAAQCFMSGERLEDDGEVKAAERAYREALALDPSHAGAALNLGAMLCEARRCADAIDLYRQAIGLTPDAPLLHFNLAIALEDQHLDREALESYERSLALDGRLADAHYNAARLHEKLGEPQGALRHYSAYRRLGRQS